MMPQILEGTWEEVAAQAQQLSGRQVRLIVLPAAGEEPYPNVLPQERPSTAGSLLQHAGIWIGDDLEECLQTVYSTRSKTEF